MNRATKEEGKMKTDQRLDKEVQKLRTAVEELTVLNDLAIAASSSLEVDKMLDTIVQKSIKAVKAEQGSISLVTEEKEKPFRTLIRHVDRTNQLPKYRVGVHISGWVLKNQKPLIVEELSQDERFQVTEEEIKEIRSVLCVPIWCRAKIIGILMMINKKSGEPFNSNDLRLLSIIAAQSGQFIRNSQLQEEALEKKRMEQELVLARRIQLSLLPEKEPVGFGLDVATYFSPAEEVGGDYYDYFPLRDQEIGIVIADVSGHGSPAAMMMTMVKGVLHSIIHTFISADQALHEINSILTRIIPKDIFITMQFLVFDIKKKILHFSNAGHNPLFFYTHKTRSSEMVQLPGCALNLVPMSTFKEKKISLNTGDLIFIYTDGVTESVNEKMEMFEENRLVEIVEKNVSQSSNTIIEHVKKELVTFTGKKPQADDILMIAIKVE